MAATLLQSVVSPRSLTVSSNLSTPAMGSSICAVKALSLPHFRGLKAQLGSPKRSSRVSVRSQNGKLRGGGGVVCESQETTAVEVPEVTEPTWKNYVLESDLPVLVEFWAPWCGPCRMIHPVVDELAKEYSGKLKCFKLNTDESPAIATQYGIRSIPTVMLFKNGEKKDAIVGAVPKTTLTTGIEKFL